MNQLIYDSEGDLKVDRMIELLESFEIYAKLNNAATDKGLMNLSRNDLKRGKGQQTAENTREALLFFFSEDGAYLRGLLENSITEGIDSLSKGALL